MKSFLLTASAITLVVVIFSCTKDEEPQTFDYCDFNDVVLRYPDTTGIGKDTFYLTDSVLINIECKPNTFFTVYSFVDRTKGKPLSPFTNKGMSANGDFCYWIKYLNGSICSFLPLKKGDEVIDNPYVPPGNKPHITWMDRFS